MNACHLQLFGIAGPFESRVEDRLPACIFDDADAKENTTAAAAAAAAAATAVAVAANTKSS